MLCDDPSNTHDRIHVDISVFNTVTRRGRMDNLPSADIYPDMFHRVRRSPNIPTDNIPDGNIGPADTDSAVLKGVGLVGKRNPDLAVGIDDKSGTVDAVS